MKKFESPEVVVMELVVADVITASATLEEDETPIG